MYSTVPPLLPTWFYYLYSREQMALLSAAVHHISPHSGLSPKNPVSVSLQVSGMQRHAYLAGRG